MVEDPVFGMRHEFRRGDGVLHVETWVEPGGGVTPHVHPAMEERFTVHEGRCQFLSGRRWVEAGPGEVVVVPAGTRHAFRNRGDVVTRIVCDATPPSTLEAFLTEVAALSRQGKLLKAGIPAPRGVLEAAALAERHRDMVHLGFPSPPAFVVAPLARLAARRGVVAPA